MLRKILYIFIIFNFFSINSNAEIINNYNPNLIDNNKEFCKSNNKKFSNNKILLKELNHISIDMSNQRKWYKNLFRAIIWHGINTPKKFRKNFKAKVKINFKNNLECEFKAKVRIHGDGKDHLQNTFNGDPYSSLHVQLTEDNIDSIVKFILFIPSTRNDDNEVFSSLIFKHLGFLAPRSRYMDAYVNGVKAKYIFQEKISKEMLENNNVTEGPIIEASHRFLWPEKKINYIEETLVQGRVSNQKWSVKNTYNLKKTTLALTKFNEGLIDDQSYHFNTNRLAYKNTVAQQELNEYQAIISSLGGFHGLSPRNTKYYFDPINLTFRPIYYDGNVNILKNNPNNSYYNDPGHELTYHAKLGANSAIKKIKKIDLKNLLNDLNQNGVDLNFKQISSIMELIIERLENISKIDRKEKEFKSINAYFSYHNDGNEDKRIVFFDDDINQIKVCKFEIDTCKNEHLSIEEIAKLFSGELKKNDNFYIFVSNNYNNYLNGLFFDNSKVLNNQFEKILLEETQILYSKGMNLKQDSKLKKIDFIQKNDSEIVLFKGGSIRNWEITFSGKKINNFKEIENMFSGCINFFRVKLINVKININNAGCNDAVNFINSSGTINKLSVNSAKTDGIDFDFSHFKIDKIFVSDVSNDCVDMSFGNYVVNKLELINCGDKAISVGESSIFEGNDIKIKGSLIGLATKDSSISKINNIEIFDSSLCVAAYRKKQEFYGADININKFKCDKNKIYYQDGSKIKITNEL